MAWNGFGFVWYRLESFGDSHDTVLCASEDSSVRAVGVGNQLDLGHGANGVSSLNSSFWHRIGDDVVGESHILVDDFLESKSGEEDLASLVKERVLPDDLLLALS